MATLEEALASDDKRQIVIEDCLVILDQEVADKRGLSGLAIKAGFKAVKSVKPGFIRGVVHDLIPEFAKALDPLFQEAKEGNEDVAKHFVTHSAAAADALLSITDKKAVKSTNRVVKGTYDKLRGQAKKSVEAAMPRLGTMIAKHAS